MNAAVRLRSASLAYFQRQDNPAEGANMLKSITVAGAVLLAGSFYGGAQAHEERTHDWHSGYHRDWHSGGHKGWHRGYHFDWRHGWHSGEHYGWHRGRHYGGHRGEHHDWYRSRHRYE